MGSGQSSSSLPYADVEVQNTPDASPEDQQLLSDLSPVSDRLRRALAQFAGYQGSGQLIRAAISTPTPDTESRAFQSVRSGVMKLAEYHTLSVSLAESLPRLYSALTGGGSHCGDVAIQRHPAFARLLCDALDFALRFDDIKMASPAVQNDLAFYRRILSRLKRERKLQDGELRDEVVDKMSLFYASAAPMTRIVIECTRNAPPAQGAGGRSGIGGLSPVCQTVARLAASCHGMVRDGKVGGAEARQLCLRVMTVSIVVLDHAVDQGVFGKKTPVDIVAFVKLLQGWTEHPTDGLLNALRFMTRTVREPNVKGFIKKALW